MAIGALAGGKMIPYGRRLAMILMAIVGSIGVILTLIQNFYVLLIGRVIFGFAAGSQGVIVIRMIDDYAPENLKSICFGLFQATGNLGIFLVMLGGLILPKDTDTKGLEKN